MRKTAILLGAAALVFGAGCPAEQPEIIDAGPTNVDAFIPSEVDGGPPTRDTGPSTGDTGPSTGDTGPSTGDTGPIGGDAGPLPAANCAAPIDLSTAGEPLEGAVGRRVRASTAAALDATLSEVPEPRCGSPTHALVFKYTMTADAFLFVTTSEDPAASGMDTVVWLLDGCSTSATELGCNDDGDSPGYLSDLYSTRGFEAGDDVYIVVASYDWSGSTPGEFGLRVREVTPIGAGEACDNTSPPCVTGYSCVEDTGGPGAGHCLEDGTEGGACHLDEPHCDSGLQCDVDEPDSWNPGTCVTPIPVGGACSSEHFVCVAGAACQLDEGSDDAGHCIADGDAFGRCRTSGDACDSGLECSNPSPTEWDTGTCQAPIAVGELCTARHFVCVSNATCQYDDGSTETQHCVQDGLERSACRLTMPYCDAGLTCSIETPDVGDRGQCFVPIATGEPCSTWHYLCVEGSHCVPDEGSDTLGHCLLDGSEGGACRADVPECDPPLECDWWTATCLRP